jgi:hypothetical protein
MNPVLPRAFPVAAALLALAACAPGGRDQAPAPSTTASAVGSNTVSPSPPKAPGPEELAVLAPLAVGSDLGGFKVREIQGVERGVMRIVCAREKEIVRLDVAFADESDASTMLPPATAGRYAIFYSLRGAVPEDGDRLARALAKVLLANAAAPAPAGMTIWTPRPKPPTTL